MSACVYAHRRVTGLSLAADWPSPARARPDEPPDARRRCRACGAATPPEGFSFQYQWERPDGEGVCAECEWEVVAEQPTADYDAASLDARHRRRGGGGGGGGEEIEAVRGEARQGLTK